jgi:hypothetical protein
MGAAAAATLLLLLLLCFVRQVYVQQRLWGHLRPRNKQRICWVLKESCMQASQPR